MAYDDQHGDDQHGDDQHGDDQHGDDQRRDDQHGTERSPFEARKPGPRRDTPNPAHPAGSAFRNQIELPRVVGRIRGISTEVDSDGDCLLILHLENDFGTARHKMVLNDENLFGLHQQLGECLEAVGNIEALGVAADEILSDFDGIWVDGPGQTEP